MLSYWHGGIPGLRVGDIITPPPPGDDRHLRDGCPTCEARRQGAPLAGDLNNPSKVYITTSRDYARIYAAGYPRGDLYRVEPVGPMEPTVDDAVPSWGVGAARVVTIYERCITLTPARLAALLRRIERSQPC